jgi:predicted TIM-barrel fold metal-dependent hydrolase
MQNGLYHASWPFLLRNARVCQRICAKRGGLLRKRTCTWLVFCFAMAVHAQETDPQLMSYIDSIKAVDNHAHVIAPDVPDDKGYDALRCDVLPSTTDLAPANLRFGADTQTTWKALYGTVPKTADEAGQRREAMLAGLRTAHGENYYDWVLDQSGIEMVLANRVAMTPGLKPPRFRWIPYVDALLFPFDNKGLENNPDRHELFLMEDDLRRRYFRQSGLNQTPPTLDEYVEKVVLPTLRRQKAAGAVAIKFEAAYLRALDFAPVSHAEADAVYRRSVNGPAPKPADYKILQDYLFQVIAAEAGKSSLPVHLHTGVGCGEFFDIAGSDPILLDKVFNDPTLRGTTFVILHGGSPFERHIITLIMKPNVYVDTSELELMFSPSELARILRPWLESMPEHILFGTDADFFGPGMGWQETTWLGSRNARRALGIVLTEMVKENVISSSRAREIAERVLRGNAWALYHLGTNQ